MQPMGVCPKVATVNQILSALFLLSKQFKIMGLGFFKG